MKILITGGSGFIGTNFIEFLSIKGLELINLDSMPPRKDDHRKFWKECNILDYPRLEKIIKEFAPTHVVHLAAKTGINARDINEFVANMEGVSNLINILRNVPSTERVIFTSSLLVCKMGYVPSSDIDYNATTLYGQSKVEGEKIVRAAKDLAFAWTIIRPISVWGPWQEEPYINFFKSVAQGWYFHIGSGHYKRSMGYVENMAYQIYQLLGAPKEKVGMKTFYLGDSEPVDLYILANEIRSLAQSKEIRHLPLWAVKFVAKMGDVLVALGLKRFPLTSFRLNNICTEYVFNLSPITEITGKLPFDFETSVARTVRWMQESKEI